jgi:hypothetical protein
MRGYALYRDSFFGIGHPNVADTKDIYFWCRSSLGGQHVGLLVLAILS